MLDEFGPQSAAVNAALAAAPGTVDISSLSCKGTALANKVFTGTTPGGAASLLARKEAFDFVAAYSRIGVVLGQTRAQYYAEAPAAQAKEAARITRLTGSLNTYARLGD